MKIEIEVSFSETQKAQIVSRNEQIPPHAVSFEVSNRYVGMLQHFQGDFEVSNQSIHIRKNVRYSAIEKYHHISNIISDSIANAIFTEGDNIDPIMQGLEDVIESDKNERAMRSEQRAKDDKRRKLNAPLEKWKEYNLRKVKSREIAIQDAEKQAKDDKIEAEKLAWIDQYGSERLKEGIKQGYNCQKTYVFEKGKMILGPDYKLDYAGDVSTKDRSCPTMSALEEINSLKEKGINSTIVWLPDGLHQLNDPAACDDTYDYESCEAVEVRLPGLQGYWYMIF